MSDLIRVLWRIGCGGSKAGQLSAFSRAGTNEEIAEVLTVSKINIFKAKAGCIPSFRIGTRVRFDPRSVAQWLRRS